MAASEEDGEAGDGHQFEVFAAIVDEYIRRLSPSEVNIESKTTTCILNNANREKFLQLDLVSEAFRGSFYFEGALVLRADDWNGLVNPTYEVFPEFDCFEHVFPPPLQEVRRNLLAPAAKEIRKMLTENVLIRFKACEQYCQVAEMFLSME